jgi:NAD(P)-dependent dehydrogenase (short-subunit alcohol dehydrogenase family)
MQDLLAGRVAIVTGGARGIGLAVAQTLGLLGASVLIVDNGAAIDGGPEDPAVTELATMRVPGAIGLSVDAAADGVAHQAVAAAIDAFGHLDLVVNNAAIEADAPVGSGTRADFERMLRTNLVAPWAMAAAAVGPMRKQARAGRRPGAMVNVGSSVGLYGRAGRAGEASSKAGLIGLMRTLALELADARIACNAIVPFAGTRTVRAGGGADAAQTAWAAWAERTASLSVTDVANLVAFLASPQAAGISGQLLGVRGREVFVWTQARPAGSCFQPRSFDADEFAAALGALRRDFVDLHDDLEAFGNDPVA